MMHPPSAVFLQIMSGEATPGQIGALLAALRVKGETAEEIAGAALTMRALSTKVPAASETLVDTCGTGGSGSKLFNISTAAAFVAASAGAKVAKHGNRKMKTIALISKRIISLHSFARLARSALRSTIKHSVHSR